MIHAAIYARFSSSLQSESSIDAQLRECRAFCEQRGYAVVAEHLDREESGSSTRRPAFNALMADVRAGRCGVIVSHKLDRLSRNMTDVVLTMRELNQHGVQYVSVLEQFDFTTPIGRIILAVLAALAEWYLANLKTEINKGKRQRAISGKSNASIMPFGYARGEQGVATPDDGAPHTHWAFTAYAGGLHSYAAIAAELNRRGLVTRRGGPWNAENVREMLQNPFYAGWVAERGLLDQQTASGTRRRVPRSKRKLYRGLHEPIVSQELFDKCQAKMRERRRSEGGRGYKRKERYLFGGIAYCASCGRKLTAGAWADGRYANYTCLSHRLNLSCEAKRYSVTESLLAPLAEAKIAQISLPGEIERRAVEIANGQQTKSDHERRRKRLESERDRLNTMFQKGHLDEAKWESEVSRVKGELTELQAQPEPVDQPAAIEQLHQLTELWSAASEVEKSLILKTIFERVEVDTDAKVIVRWVARPDFADLIREKSPDRV